jgi:hypothetical protein
MTQVAKQMTMLIFIAIVLVVAVAGFFFTDNSLAWFSENDTVEGEGISVNAKATPNLIIAKSAEELKNGEVNFSIDFRGAAREDMIAVTHDPYSEGTFLKYVTNHYAVDTVTGNVKEGMDLGFESVPTSDNEQYFVDYEVYIASAYDLLKVSSLSATIVVPRTVDNPCFNAVSIDFYVGEVSLEGYRGTTAVVDNIKGTERAAVELMPGGATIPLNTGGEYIKVIMRCYFDGALQDPGTNHAYVNSFAVEPGSTVVGVSFMAIDAETAE